MSERSLAGHGSFALATKATPILAEEFSQAEIVPADFTMTFKHTGELSGEITLQVSDNLVGGICPTDNSLFYDIGGTYKPSIGRGDKAEFKVTQGTYKCARIKVRAAETSSDLDNKHYKVKLK